jgi:hypothetical protein
MHQKEDGAAQRQRTKEMPNIVVIIEVARLAQLT